MYLDVKKLFVFIRSAFIFRANQSSLNTKGDFGHQLHCFFINIAATKWGEVVCMEQ